MSDPWERRRARQAAQLAEHERQLEAIRRRLRWAARTPEELARSLELPGGTVGLHGLLRELASRGEAHERDGVWHAGPAPTPAPEADPEVEMASVREQVLAVLGKGGWYTADEVAERTGLIRSSVSSALSGLKGRGQLISMIADGGLMQYALPEQADALAAHDQVMAMQQAGERIRQLETELKASEQAEQQIGQQHDELVSAREHIRRLEYQQDKALTDLDLEQGVSRTHLARIGQLDEEVERLQVERDDLRRQLEQGQAAWVEQTDRLAHLEGILDAIREATGGEVPWTELAHAVAVQGQQYARTVTELRQAEQRIAKLKREVYQASARIAELTTAHEQVGVGYDDLRAKIIAELPGSDESSTDEELVTEVRIRVRNGDAHRQEALRLAATLKRIGDAFEEAGLVVEGSIPEHVERVVCSLNEAEERATTAEAAHAQLHNALADVLRVDAQKATDEQLVGEVRELERTAEEQANGGEHLAIWRDQVDDLHGQLAAAMTLLRQSERHRRVLALENERREALEEGTSELVAELADVAVCLLDCALMLGIRPRSLDTRALAHQLQRHHREQNAPAAQRRAA